MPAPAPTSDILRELVDVPKPIIGTVHVAPLPGSPQYDGASLREIATRAVDDAQTYVDGGVDMLIIENAGDVPYRRPELIGPETVAGLTAVGVAVREALPDVPTGVIVVAHAVQQSIAIAQAIGGTFVRANQWVNAYIANEGYIEGAAAEALRFRAAIGAGDVRILADVHVKHGSHAIVGDLSISQLTHDVETFGADVLIATGHHTGDPTRVEEVEAIKTSASRSVLVGSGLDGSNAGELLGVADGAIVGSAMKWDGVWWERVDPARVEAIMREVASVR
ncbi:MAG: BtpA/SgcQ family protein [Nitriliruptor sp.]|uniref:BtpA/SgcQ family protein n=1 Tax=Nitriliruptor sp. TaxID=2448056 RepID=UPI0034A0294D